MRSVNTYTYVVTSEMPVGREVVQRAVDAYVARRSFMKVYMRQYRTSGPKKAKSNGSGADHGK